MRYLVAVLVVVFVAVESKPSVSVDGITVGEGLEIPSGHGKKTSFDVAVGKDGVGFNKKTSTHEEEHKDFNEANAESSTNAENDGDSSHAQGQAAASAHDHTETDTHDTEHDQGFNIGRGGFSTHDNVNKTDESTVHDQTDNSTAYAAAGRDGDSNYSTRGGSQDSQTIDKHNKTQTYDQNETNMSLLGKKSTKHAYGRDSEHEETQENSGSHFSETEENSKKGGQQIHSETGEGGGYHGVQQSHGSEHSDTVETNHDDNNKHNDQLSHEQGFFVPHEIFRQFNIDAKKLGLPPGNYKKLTSANKEKTQAYLDLRAEFMQAIADKIHNTKIISTMDGGVKIVDKGPGAWKYGKTRSKYEDFKKSHYPTLAQKMGKLPMSSHSANVQYIESRYGPVERLSSNYGKIRHGNGNTRETHKVHRDGTSISGNKVKGDYGNHDSSLLKVPNYQVSDAEWEKQASEDAEKSDREKENYDKVDYIDPIVKKAILTTSVSDILKTIGKSREVFNALKSNEYVDSNEKVIPISSNSRKRVMINRKTVDDTYLKVENKVTGIGEYNIHATKQIKHKGVNVFPSSATKHTQSSDYLIRYENIPLVNIDTPETPVETFDNTEYINDRLTDNANKKTENSYEIVKIIADSEINRHSDTNLDKPEGFKTQDSYNADTNRKYTLRADSSVEISEDYSDSIKGRSIAPKLNSEYDKFVYSYDGNNKSSDKVTYFDKYDETTSRMTVTGETGTYSTVDNINHTSDSSTTIKSLVDMSESVTDTTNTFSEDSFNDLSTAKTKPDTFKLDTIKMDETNDSTTNKSVIDSFGTKPSTTHMDISLDTSDIDSSTASTNSVLLESSDSTKRDTSALNSTDTDLTNSDMNTYNTTLLAEKSGSDTYYSHDNTNYENLDSKTRTFDDTSITYTTIEPYTTYSFRTTTAISVSDSRIKDSNVDIISNTYYSDITPSNVSRTSDDSSYSTSTGKFEGIDALSTPNIGSEPRDFNIDTVSNTNSNDAYFDKTVIGIAKASKESTSSSTTKNFDNELEGTDVFSTTSTSLSTSSMDALEDSYIKSTSPAYIETIGPFFTENLATTESSSSTVGTNYLYSDAIAVATENTPGPTTIVSFDPNSNASVTYNRDTGTEKSVKDDTERLIGTNILSTNVTASSSDMDATYTSKTSSRDTTLTALLIDSTEHSSDVSNINKEIMNPKSDLNSDTSTVNSNTGNTEISRNIPNTNVEFMKSNTNGTTSSNYKSTTYVPYTNSNTDSIYESSDTSINEILVPTYNTYSAEKNVDILNSYVHKLNTNIDSTNETSNIENTNLDSNTDDTENSYYISSTYGPTKILNTDNINDNSVTGISDITTMASITVSTENSSYISRTYLPTTHSYTDNLNIGRDTSNLERPLMNLNTEGTGFNSNTLNPDVATTDSNRMNMDNDGVTIDTNFASKDSNEKDNISDTLHIDILKLERNDTNVIATTNTELPTTVPNRDGTDNISFTSNADVTTIDANRDGADSISYTSNTEITPDANRDGTDSISYTSNTDVTTTDANRDGTDSTSYTSNAGVTTPDANRDGIDSISYTSNTDVTTTDANRDGTDSISYTSNTDVTTIDANRDGTDSTSYTSNADVTTQDANRDGTDSISYTSNTDVTTTDANRDGTDSTSYTSNTDVTTIDANRDGTDSTSYTSNADVTTQDANRDGTDSISYTSNTAVTTTDANRDGTDSTSYTSNTDVTTTDANRDETDNGGDESKAYVSDLDSNTRFDNDSILTDSSSVTTAFSKSKNTETPSTPSNVAIDDSNSGRSDTSVNGYSNTGTSDYTNFAVTTSVSSTVNAAGNQTNNKPANRRGSANDNSSKPLNIVSDENKNDDSESASRSDENRSVLEEPAVSRDPTNTYYSGSAEAL